MTVCPFMLYILSLQDVYKGQTHLTMHLSRYPASLTLKSFSFCWSLFNWKMTYGAPWDYLSVTEELLTLFYSKTMISDRFLHKLWYLHCWHYWSKLWQTLEAKIYYWHAVQFLLKILCPFWTSGYEWSNTTVQRKDNFHIVHTQHKHLWIKVYKPQVGTHVWYGCVPREGEDMYDCWYDSSSCDYQKLDKVDGHGCNSFHCLTKRITNCCFRAVRPNRKGMQQDSLPQNKWSKQRCSI